MLCLQYFLRIADMNTGIQSKLETWKFTKDCLYQRNFLVVAYILSRLLELQAKMAKLNVDVLSTDLQNQLIVQRMLHLYMEISCVQAIKRSQ